MRKGNFVSWFGKDKEAERFYLLPGMGGKALQQKRKFMLWWGIGVGLLVSFLLAGLMYWMCRG